MQKTLKWAAAFSFAGTLLAWGLFWRFHREIYLTLAITFGTTAYHLGMRMLVAAFYHVKMKNQADYTKKWYQPCPWEETLYRFLRVKSWKSRMPTYDPDTFSAEHHTWEELAQAMCQSELVHETNAVFSFLPLTGSIWFGSFYVFLITSVCGAVFDLTFAVIQRYNRPRAVKIARRQQQRKKASSAD